MSSEPISGLPAGTPTGTNLLVQSTGAAGQTQKITEDQLTEFVKDEIIDVGLGEVAVGLVDGTLAGFSSFAYDAGAQKVVMENARISLFLQEGVVHNDNSGNLSSSLIVNADVSPSANIDYSKINSDTLGNGYTTFVAAGATINLTNPLYNRIVTTGGGSGIIKFPKMDDIDSMSSGKNSFSLITNNCGAPIFIQDFVSSAIATINPGQSKLFFITSNGSPAGGFNTLDVTGIINTSAPLTYNSGFLGILQSNTSTDGFLSYTDWNTFNSKQNSDVLGSGYLALTVAAGTINLTNPLANRIIMTGLGTGSVRFPVMNAVDSMTAGRNTFCIITNNCSALNDICNNAGTIIVQIPAAAIYAFFVENNGSANGAFNFIDITPVTSSVFGSSPNANGYSLDGQALILQPANSTNPGGITTGVQTLAGDKTFIGNISAANLSGTNTGNVTGAVVDTGAPNTSGLNLSGQQLSLTSASGSFPGVVSTGTQSFAGNKTFTGSVTASNLSGTNTGDITVSAVGSTPNANGLTLTGQTLNLQPANLSNPGALTATTQTIGGAKTFNTAPNLNSLTASTVLVLDGVNNIVSSAITSAALSTLNRTANQILYGNGTSGITSSAALTYGSNRITLTGSQCGFQASDNTGFMGVGPFSAGAGPIFGYAGTGGSYFGNAAAGDCAIRQDNTATSIRIGLGIATSQLSISNTLISTNVAVVIGTSSINASAQLQVDSTTKGILLPRGTSAQRVAISSPAQFLEFNDTDLGYKFLYDTTASDWNPIFNRRIPQTKTVTSSVDFTTENWFINNGASTPVTISLPLLSAGKPGMTILIIKTSANSANLVTIAAGGADVINPIGAFTIAAQYNAWKFIHMGTFWLSTLANVI